MKTKITLLLLVFLSIKGFSQDKLEFKNSSTSGKPNTITNDNLNKNGATDLAVKITGLSFQEEPFIKRKYTITVTNTGGAENNPKDIKCFVTLPYEMKDFTFQNSRDIRIFQQNGLLVAEYLKNDLPKFQSFSFDFTATSKKEKVKNEQVVSAFVCNSISDAISCNNYDYIGFLDQNKNETCNIEVINKPINQSNTEQSHSFDLFFPDWKEYELVLVDDICKYISSVCGGCYGNTGMCGDLSLEIFDEQILVELLEIDTKTSFHKTIVKETVNGSTHSLKTKGFSKPENGKMYAIKITRRDNAIRKNSNIKIILK